MDLANPLIMGQMAQTTNVLPGIQNAIFGEQQRQQNASTLDTQARESEARKAMATLVTTPDLTPEQVNALMVPIAAHDPGAVQAYRQQQAMQADMATLLKNPNPQSVGAFMMRYPGAAENVSKAWDAMSSGQAESAFRTASDTYGYLLAGDAPGAAKVLQSHIDADKAAGMDTSEYEHLLDVVRQQPEQAKVIAGMLIASRVGPEKFGETYSKFAETNRANELQPSAVQKAEADASKAVTEAQYAAPKMESDLATAEAQRQKWQADIADAKEQRRLGWANLGLEQDKLETQTQLKLQELAAQSGKVPDSAIGAINQRITDAATSGALANRANDLAAELRASGARGGLGSTWAEWLKGKTGNQDAVSQLRSEVAQFNNSAALKLLPPGPASDKDVAFVKSGFPKPTDPPEYVARWLETYGKLQQRVAAASERQGNWMAANGGSLGPAKTDITVGGIQVRAGTPFTKFNASGVAQEGSASLPPSIDMLAQRYGKR